MQQILIVEEDQALRQTLRSLLERHGFSINEAMTVKEAIENFDLDSQDVIITNLRLSGAPGTDLIPLTPTPVLVLSSLASQRTAGDNLDIAAVDFLAIPIDPDQVLAAIERLGRNYVKQSNQACADRAQCGQPVSGMRGKCPEMIELFRRIRKVGQTDAPVLIQGESGTGKELVARGVHENSARRNGNLVAVNCAAIAENLIESELFGYAKGAFPGANVDHTGLVESANNGTLFLDEISELPLDAQARLLRVVQEHEIRKVGSVHSMKVDVRLVAATSRDLAQLVAEGRFRDDLYYRINVMPLQIPPLRRRCADILELADAKLEKCCDKLGVSRKRFSSDAIQAIATYPWPGNVRELENVIERAVVLTEGDLIPVDFLGLDIRLVSHEDVQAQSRPAPVSKIREDGTDALSPENMSLKDYFQRFVLDNQDQLNETELAKKLGISRKCLWERRQRFNIPRKKKTG